MGVTILGRLGYLVAGICALVAVVAFALPSAEAPVAAAFPFPGLGAQAIGAALGVFAVALAVTAWAFLRRERWAWLAALGIVAFSAAPDLARIARADWSGLLGLLAVALMLGYLLRPEVRAWINAP
jgi:hypothetical protein